MGKLAAIRIYPIKSLDPLELDSSPLMTGGGLRYDRQWALVNGRGEFINAKRTADIHKIRSAVELRHRMVTLSAPEKTEATFHIDQQKEEIESWFSEFFGEPVRLMENTSFGFPDDTESPGPTIVSTATLETVAGWFPELSPEEIRRRFRANLEIGGVEPFWEDRLYGPPGETVRFQIGEVLFEGVNPCQRCPVPTRDSLTGDVWPGFARAFADRREELLPGWANRERFNHFYRLSTNTRLMGSSAGVLSVGDEIRLLDS
ncbi:MAG: MOSC N-terminal beta barrel domain-containing protein [Planctomycetales bacterium]